MLLLEQSVTKLMGQTDEQERQRIRKVVSPESFALMQSLLTHTRMTGVRKNRLFTEQHHNGLHQLRLLEMNYYNLSVILNLHQHGAKRVCTI